jgi:hypothetical protein
MFWEWDHKPHAQSLSQEFQDYPLTCLAWVTLTRASALLESLSGSVVHANLFVMRQAVVFKEQLFTYFVYFS